MSPSLFDPDTPGLPGMKCAVALEIALVGVREIREATFDRAPYREHRPMPRYRSRIERLDLRCGGFYGMTVIAGGPGVGKSELALGTAIEAACPASDDDPERGWRVFYLDAELTEHEREDRFNHVAAGHPDPYACLDRLHALPLGLGNAHPDLVRPRIERKLEEHGYADEKVLVICDSVNSLAKLQARGSDQAYFTAVEDWLLWGKEAVRISEGSVAFLMIFEVSKSGGTRGSASAEFWANLAVRMTAGREEHEVNIDVRKGRQGGRGPLGKYVLDWRRGLFLLPDDPRLTGQPNLRVVDGGRDDDFGI